MSLNELKTSKLETRNRPHHSSLITHHWEKQMIRVEKLVKRAGVTEILHGVDFEVPAQTVLGIIGASGSGKTTLLRCLNGLERISAGMIDCDGVLLDASLS